jgi:hypothetical protein
MDINKTISENTELKKPKEPKPEDFNLTEERIASLIKGPKRTIYRKIRIAASLILPSLLIIKSFGAENNLVDTILGAVLLYFLIFYTIGALLEYILETYFPSLKSKHYQSWLGKQPDYENFMQYKNAKDDYKKELANLKDQKRKIRESRQRKVSSNLIEYKFPTGLKVYYPSYFEILKDDLDEEDTLNEGKDDYSLLKTIFFAYKPDPSLVAFKPGIYPEIITKPPNFSIEILRNGYEELGFHLMMRREDMFVKFLRGRGYTFNEDEVNKEFLIKMYIKQAIDNFADKVRKPMPNIIKKFSGINWNKPVEIKKIEENAVIWIEKLKFENYSQLFIRTGKYLLYCKGDNFYAITINILATPKIYGENIDLINTIIEKSGFDN